MSELLKPIEVRRARRAISDRPIPKETLERLLTAATYAPSCSNNQPWRLVVVERKDQLENAKQYLKEHPEIAEKIEMEIRQASGQVIPASKSEEIEDEAEEEGLLESDLEEEEAEKDE